jgi:hypothetical protein
MNDYKGKIFEVVQQLMPHLLAIVWAAATVICEGSVTFTSACNRWPSQRARISVTSFTPATCVAPRRISSMMFGSTPSSILEKIYLPPMGQDQNDAGGKPGDWLAWTAEKIGHQYCLAVPGMNAWTKPKMAAIPTPANSVSGSIAFVKVFSCAVAPPYSQR